MEPIILPLAEPLLWRIAPSGYRPQSTDCSIEADLLQFELLRRWSPTQRLIQAASLMRSARQLSLNAHLQRFPQLSTAELGQKLARTWLQEYCPPAYIPTGTEMTWLQDSIQLAAQLHDLFEALLMALQLPKANHRISRITTAKIIYFQLKVRH
jgi:hypothetical protein